MGKSEMFFLTHGVLLAMLVFRNHTLRVSVAMSCLFHIFFLDFEDSKPFPCLALMSLVRSMSSVTELL